MVPPAIYEYHDTLACNYRRGYAMARCYISGAEFAVEHGYVLNKRAVYTALRALKSKVAALEYLLQQLGAVDEARRPAPAHDGKLPWKLRRLVSRAIAEALSTSHPGIELFVPWPVYRAQPMVAKLLGLWNDPKYGTGIRTLDESRLLEAAILGRQVLALLEQRAKKLPERTRKAIWAGICVKTPGFSAERVVELIQVNLESTEKLVSLGVPEAESGAFATQMCISLAPAGIAGAQGRPLDASAA